MGAVVIAVDVGGDLGSGLFDGLPLGPPGAALLELPEPGLDECLGFGVAVAATPMGHTTGREVPAEVPRGELAAVEFLSVVKRGGGVHARRGTSGVLERSATPFLTRSSRRVALRTLAMERRASRIWAGIW